MSSTLGIAVIGAGRMGADHVRRIGRTVGGARVVAVADPDGDRVKEVVRGLEGACAYTDAAAAVAAPGVEAVLIASPGPAHEEAILLALGRELPVLCEKPLTPEPAGALRVMEAEQRLGRRLVQVGFMRRYDAEYERLKELLDAGGLGRPLFLHCRHRNALSPSWFTSDMLISDSVVHEVDAARWLLDQEITAVSVLSPTPSSAAPRGCAIPGWCCWRPPAGRSWTWRSSSTAVSATRCSARRSANRAAPGSATATRWSSSPPAGGAGDRPGLHRTVRRRLRPPAAALGGPGRPGPGRRPDGLGRLRRGRRLRGGADRRAHRRPHRRRTDRAAALVPLNYVPLLSQTSPLCHGCPHYAGLESQPGDSHSLPSPCVVLRALPE